MARWSIVVWAGLAVAGAGLFFPSVLATFTGPAIWLFIALLVAAGVVAWLAASGNRNLRLLLVAATGLAATLAILATLLVFGLSLGQSSLVETIGWPVVAAGTVAAFIGAIGSLRAPEAPGL